MAELPKVKLLVCPAFLLCIRGSSKEDLMFALIKIIYSIFFVTFLVGTSLIIIRTCWGVWLTVSDIATFIKLPLNQSPELATQIAIGLGAYFLVIVKSTYNLMKK
jgi:hypothetical protein